MRDSKYEGTHTHIFVCPYYVGSFKQFYRTVPINVKAETHPEQVVNLLVCLEPLEGMLHLPLSVFLAHSDRLITEYNAH